MEHIKQSGLEWMLQAAEKEKKEKQYEQKLENERKLNNVQKQLSPEE